MAVGKMEAGRDARSSEGQKLQSLFLPLNRQEKGRRAMESTVFTEKCTGAQYIQLVPMLNKQEREEKEPTNHRQTPEESRSHRILRFLSFCLFWRGCEGETPNLLFDLAREGDSDLPEGSRGEMVLETTERIARTGSFVPWDSPVTHSWKVQLLIKY